VGGKIVFTAEEKLGKDLFAADGQEIEALVRPAKKAGRFVVIDFHFSPQ
jgi:hypothetical protein